MGFPQFFGTRSEIRGPKVVGRGLAFLKGMGVLGLRCCVS